MLMRTRARWWCYDVVGWTHDTHNHTRDARLNTDRSAVRRAWERDERWMKGAAGGGGGAGSWVASWC
jgi:hypothetical protein